MQNSKATSKAFIAFITLTAFLSSSSPLMPYAEAQSSVDSSSATVPQSNPITLTGLAGLQGGLSAAVGACDLKFPIDNSTTGGVVGTAGQILSSAEKAKKDKKDAAKADKDSKQCYDVSSKEFSCTMQCPPPTEYENVKCTDLYDTNSMDGAAGTKKKNYHTPQVLEGSDGKKVDAITYANKEIDQFLAFLKFKGSQCTANNSKAIKAQVDNYSCKMEALKAMAGQASSQIQQALNQNKAIYAKMIQFQKQVTSQMTEIDEVLGPDKQDPNSTKGLIGIENELETAVVKLKTQSVDFKKQAISIKSETAKNKQTLEASRLQQVVECLKGDSRIGVNGGAMLCDMPVMGPSVDATGKAITPQPTGRYAKQACGPLAFLRNQVANAAVRTGQSNSRRDQSDADAAEFDAIVGSIETDLGAANKPAADGSLLVSNVSSWADISKKYAARLANLDARLTSEGKTSYNILGNLNKVAGSCYSEGDKWKKQQLNSAGSTYNTQKDKIAGETDSLNQTLSNGMLEANSRYGDAMALLGASRKNISNQCVSTDPDKMVSCFDNVTTQMGYVLNGGGGVGVTTKAISGGSQVGGFAISCSGVKPCVDAFRNARTLKKTQFTNAQKATDDFVTNGKAAIDAQLSQFGAGLAQIQNAVTAQFGNLQNKLAEMGVESSAEPKFFEKDPLQPMKGEGGAQGPYDSPRSIEGVLSSVVPGGLLNFSGSGGVAELLKSAEKEVNKKASEDAANMKTYTKAKKEIAAMSGANNSCNKDDVNAPGGSSSTADVQTTRTDRSKCEAARTACQTSVATDNVALGRITALSKTIGSIGRKDTVDEDKQDELDTQIETLIGGGCNKLSVCEDFEDIADKSGSGSDDDGREKGSSGQSGNANGPS